MSKSLLVNIGKWVFGLVFLVFGILHFVNAGGMTGYVPGWIPGSAFWVYLTGLAMILAALSILSGKMTSVAAQLLALMLLIFVLTIHLPNVIGGANPGTLLKDLGLMGGSLLIAAYLDEDEESGESS